MIRNIGTTNKNVKKFLHDAFKTLKDNNIKIKLRRTSYYEFDKKEIGIFSPQETTLNIWLKYFVHEYCHCLQQINKSQCYKKMMKNKTDLCYYKKFSNDKNQKQDFIFTRELELECERMTIKLIKKYKLPINVEKTIKEVNAYICYYHGAEKAKKWKTKKCIYDRNILNEMPKSIRNYSKRIPLDKLNIILKCF